MKLTKKLIPALGMLMLSAVMLVTSSFAWFSMNTDVTATGMNVTAKGDQVYLQIVTTEAFNDNASQNSVDASVLGENLKPITVAKSFSEDTLTPFENGQGIAWATNNSDQDDAKDAAGNYAVKTDLAGYALTQQFKVRLNPASGSVTALGDLRVSSVVLGDNESELAHSVSVLAVVELNSVKRAQLFRQGNDGQSVSGGVVSGWRTTGDDGLTGANFTNPVAGFVIVSVYVFFDGEHQDCTSTNYWNAVDNDLNNYSLTINFTCAGL